MEMRELVEHRPYTAGDHDFICATWVNGFINGQPKRGDYWFENHLEQIERHAFKVNYNRVVNHILKNPKSETIIACLKEDPTVILGYAVLEKPDTLHWVYVKEAWRKFGIARHLVPKTITTVTHLTSPGLALKRRFGLIYDPFKI